MNAPDPGWTAASKNRTVLALGLVLMLAEACASGDEATTSGTAGGRGGSGGSGGTSGGAAGQTTGGAAGSGGSAPVEDRCPGKPAVIGTQLAQISGTTSALANDLEPYCLAPSEDSSDAVHQLEVDADGTLELFVEATTPGYRPVVWIQRGQCSDLSAAVTCRRIETVPGSGGSASGGSASGGASGASASGGSGGTSSNTGGTSGSSAGTEPTTGGRFALHVSSGEFIYVIIDGAGEAGGYQLTASVQASRCGDGTLNPGEDCDPGADAVWSGCTPSCKFEPPLGDNHCGGGTVQQFSLGTGGAGAELLSGSGYTTGYDNNYQGCGSGDGSDAVLTFLDHRPGMLEFTLTPDGFDAVLMAFNSCANQTLSGQVGCSDTERSPNAPESVAFPLTPNVAHHVVVDGYGPKDWGRYAWTARFLPADGP